jgi:hypothetical protein
MPRMDAHRNYIYKSKHSHCIPIFPFSFVRQTVKGPLILVTSIYITFDTMST